MLSETTDSGYIRQPFEADSPLHNRVVGMKSHFSQMAKAQNEMHNQKQLNSTTTEDRSECLVTKALAQLFTQVDDVKRLLKEQQSGERRELLVLEFQRRNVMGSLNGFSFPMLHLKRPSVCVFWYWFCRHQSYRNGLAASPFQGVMRAESGLKFSVSQPH